MRLVFQTADQVKQNCTMVQMSEISRNKYLSHRHTRKTNKKYFLKKLYILPSRCFFRELCLLENNPNICFFRWNRTLKWCKQQFFVCKSFLTAKFLLAKIGRLACSTILTFTIFQSCRYKNDFYPICSGDEKVILSAWNSFPLIYLRSCCWLLFLNSWIWTVEKMTFGHKTKTLCRHT